jgi:hypothetical protein
VKLFDTLAKAFGYLLEYSRYANLLGGILDFFSNFLKGFVELFIYVQAELRGIFTVLFGLFDIFRPMEMYNFKNLFGTIKKDFKTGYDDVIKENQGFFDAMKSGILSKPLEEPPIPLINQNVNMNVYQDFKEKQDPDRIAFTLQQVLVGVAQNPRQSSLRSFQGSNLGSGVRMIP